MTTGQDRRDDRLPGTLWGAGIGIRGPLSDRWSIGLEIDVPKSRRSEQTFVSTSSVTHVTNTSVERTTFRESTFDLLFGRQWRGASRLSWTLLLGAGLEARQKGFLAYNGADPSPHPDPKQTPQSWLHATVGADAPIRVSPRVFIVPQIRVQWTPSFLDGCCRGTQSLARLSFRLTF